jgi:hypothetical protein
MHFGFGLTDEGFKNSPVSTLDGSCICRGQRSRSDSGIDFSYILRAPSFIEPTHLDISNRSTTYLVVVSSRETLNKLFCEQLGDISALEVLRTGLGHEILPSQCLYKRTYVRPYGPFRRVQTQNAFDKVCGTALTR